MNENLKKVLETLGTDKVLAEKMSQCKSPEEAYEMAKAVADGYTLEEFREVMTKVRDIYSKVENGENGELTEEELEEISGGMNQEETQIVWLSCATIGGATFAICAAM